MVLRIFGAVQIQGRLEGEATSPQVVVPAAVGLRGAGVGSRNVTKGLRVRDLALLSVLGVTLYSAWPLSIPPAP